MSFNAKNLSYERKEPAFLRRLKGQYGDGNATRHERPSNRPVNPRLANDDDDAPTYVVEGSNETLSKEEYEALVKGEGSGDEAAKADARAEVASGAKDEAEQSNEAKGLDKEKNSEPSRQQNVAEIGASKKRKQAKIVLDEDAEEKEAQAATKSQASGKKSKQKKKKIKLSFAEEQDE